METEISEGDDILVAVNETHGNTFHDGGEIKSNDKSFDEIEMQIPVQPGNNPRKSAVASLNPTNTYTIIAYKILMHLLLVYAVCGVTYLLLKGNETCSCSDDLLSALQTDSDESLITTEMPIFETLFPTKLPTLFPTKNPTFSPTQLPTLSPIQPPTLSPTQLPTLSPTITISSDSIMPKNGIIIWQDCTESNIPIGWTLCDGSNGSPDLRGRFVIGANDVNFIYGATGGSSLHNHPISINGTVEGHVLTVNQIPTHNHNNGGFKYLSRITGASTTTGFDNSGGSEPDILTVWPMSDVGGNESHSHGLNAYSTSGDSAHLPPYYVMCYIMKNETTFWINS